MVQKHEAILTPIVKAMETLYEKTLKRAPETRHET